MHFFFEVRITCFKSFCFYSKPYLHFLCLLDCHERLNAFRSFFLHIKIDDVDILYALIHYVSEVQTTRCFDVAQGCPFCNWKVIVVMVLVAFVRDTIFLQCCFFLVNGECGESGTEEFFCGGFGLRNLPSTSKKYHETWQKNSLKKEVINPPRIK